VPEEQARPGLAYLWEAWILEKLVIPVEGEPSTDESGLSEVVGSYHDPVLDQYTSTE
jgi:hypothetical protein